MPKASSSVTPGVVPDNHRFGFVAIVGRPNVGKSTLMNALMRQKLSIVSHKPQTTRHRVLGILNAAQYQLALVDTPGLHSDERRALNSLLNKTAQASLVDADLIVFMVEAERFTPDDEKVLEKIKDSKLDCVLVINKVDWVQPRERLFPLIEQWSQRHSFVEIIPLSALKKDQVARLPEVLAARVPLGPPMFPPDQVTDRTLAFRATEIVREKLTRYLNQEVPYGLTVQLEREQRLDDGRIELHLVIWVERPGQKKIVIGEGGQVLKLVGSKARLELNHLYGCRTHVHLWVKVRENWSDDAMKLNTLGYDPV